MNAYMFGNVGLSLLIIPQHDCSFRILLVLYAKDGIRCNTISPGLTITELVPAGSEAEKMLGALVPSHTSGTAEGVANCAVFCASDETPFMTGAEITIDGGVVLGACMGYAYVA